MYVKIDIKNLDKGHGEKFIVARYNLGELWYYGRYDSKAMAQEVASIVGGIVVEEV